MAQLTALEYSKTFFAIQHDLTKKRTCTLGLHGPWGDSSSVFIRVTFVFPRDYPQAGYPHGTPSIDLERNPLINVKTRAFMLRQLKRIRETRRPCLEACLMFLLYRSEDFQAGPSLLIDSDSSDEDNDNVTSGKSKEITVSLLRNNKNLAEPRTSQGIFAPSGLSDNTLSQHLNDARHFRKTSMLLQGTASCSPHHLRGCTAFTCGQALDNWLVTTIPLFYRRRHPKNESHICRQISQ